jgi:enterobactin synthetase component F
MQQSSTSQRDAAFWREQGTTIARRLPPSARNRLAGQTPSVRIHRLVTVMCDRRRSLRSWDERRSAAVERPAIWHMALVALVGITPEWTCRLFAAGFIFMRRTGSAALCANGPVINVLPIAMHVDPDQATLSEVAGNIAS